MWVDGERGVGGTKGWLGSVEWGDQEGLGQQMSFWGRAWGETAEAEECEESRASGNFLKCTHR